MKFNTCIKTICLLFLLFWAGAAFGQTKGLIVKAASAAGKAVLDPNGDGYVSATTAGFTTSDQTESEIPYQRLTVKEAEPTSDLANGPNCNFTDFVDDVNIYPVASYLSPANNLMFRFRLGGYAPNAKGYSILIDTDNRFGNTGADADPNYVAGNPGFEVEIELVTNFGVRLYNADGTDNPTLLTTLPYDDYAQKAIAFTTNCGDLDFFYDFYIPFSTITGFIPSFTPSTPVRMVANTVISTQSALRGPISDIGGLNDTNYGRNLEKAWGAVVNSIVPTPLSPLSSGGSFPPPRSATPTVTGPIASGTASVSGTSTEPNGTVITVYVNGVSVGTTTVTGGTWTLTGLTPLAGGASITATATATGKSVSLTSSPVVVGSTCSAAPISITCTSAKGIGGTVAAGVAAGTTIRVYNSVGTLIATVATTATQTFLYNCAGGTTNCTGGGPNCIANGTYQITAQETGKCESAPLLVCTGGATTATPVITTPASITPATTTVSGTAANNSTVRLYRNGYQITTTTASAGGAWSITGLSFSLGQVVTARAQSAGQCVSAASIAKTVSDVSTPPVVSGPISNGDTTVSGTSIEAAGTVINVLRNGVSVGTTTVDAFGNWQLTGISPSLLTGQSITATATAPGESVSATSAAVVVQARTAATATVTGSYVEGGTSVSGTSTAAVGSTIKVYIDGVLLGTTTVAAGGTWSLTGLSAANYDLYAGGVLTATATVAGQTEGVPSAGVTVACIPPQNKTMNVLTNQICESTTAQIRVPNSESGVIYTLRNSTNTANVSTSLLGTGGDIVFNSFTFTSNQTIQLQALKIPQTSCNAIAPGTANVTVNPNPPTNNSVTYNSSVSSGSSTTIDVQNTSNGFSYQLKDNSNDANVGSPVTSVANGSTVSLSTGPVVASKVYYVLVTDATRPTNCTSRLSANYTITPLPIELLYFKATLVKEGVALDWATASEKNNYYFSIERSEEGQRFSRIYTIPGAGNSPKTLFYQYTDRTPLPGISYYRLKQVDFDSTTSYSQVVAVQTSKPISILAIHPNPVAEQVSITVEADANRQIQLELTSLTGRVWLAEQRPLTAGINRITLNTSQLSAGVYLLNLVGSHLKMVTKVVKLP